MVVPDVYDLFDSRCCPVDSPTPVVIDCYRCYCDPFLLIYGDPRLPTIDTTLLIHSRFTILGCYDSRCTDSLFDSPFHRHTHIYRCYVYVSVFVTPTPTHLFIAFVIRAFAFSLIPTHVTLRGHSLLYTHCVTTLQITDVDYVRSFTICSRLRWLRLPFDPYLCLHTFSLLITFPVTHFTDVTPRLRFTTLPGFALITLLLLPTPHLYVRVTYVRCSPRLFTSRVYALIHHRPVHMPHVTTDLPFCYVRSHVRPDIYCYVDPVTSDLILLHLGIYRLLIPDYVRYGLITVLLLTTFHIWRSLFPVMLRHVTISILRSWYLHFTFAISRAVFVVRLRDSTRF